MKAFVIKNKEGEFYIDICNGMFSPYIQNATLYYYKPECIDIIKERTLDNCTIVPITICEGDLEEEIRHQICEKIRENIQKHLNVDLLNMNDCYYRMLPAFILAEILDQIEKGE